MTAKSMKDSNIAAPRGAAANVATAYALAVDTDALEPRYRRGEVVYVNPHRPLTNGCFVAVQLGNGQLIIRQLVKREGDILVLDWFNPAGHSSRVHFSEIRQVHRIVGCGEADDADFAPVGSVAL